MNTRISRNSPCVCGSGRRYKACCGSENPPHWGDAAVGRLANSLLDPSNAQLVADEPQCQCDIPDLPPGIFVQPLGDDYPWQSLADTVLGTAQAREAAIVRAGKLVRDPQRVTQIVEQGESAAQVTDLVRRAYCGPIENFFKRRLRWFERPQILRYQPGGFYRTHSDADAWVKPEQRWNRVLDRDLSLLIYLDDNYQGGELVFPNFNFRLRPRAGMLVAFPADYRYLHGAMPVITGARHVIVSWSSLEDVAQIHPDAPQDAVIIDR
jgi:predicted 2-oxoglutarate/Fe(II)-dependent dioxygenase YbiX